MLKRLVCPDKQMRNGEEALGHRSRTSFDLEGQGAEAGHQEMLKRLVCPDKQMGKGEEALPPQPLHI